MEIAGGGGGRQTSHVTERQSVNTPDITTEPTETVTTPISPIPPSPLATSSPANPAQPTPSLTPTPDTSNTTAGVTSDQVQARASTSHTLTFSNPRGTTTTKTIPDGDRVKRPENPTSEGYLFDGWFIDNTSVAYDFSKPVSNDLNLTARWTKGWSMSPVQGPSAGNTKVTLTPPGPRGIRFSQVSAGKGHTVAVASDGNLYAWGSNDHGQLGDGTKTDRHEPIRVEKPQGTPQNFAWIHASAGHMFSMGLGSDGKIYGWGSNTYGQLGDGTTNDHYTPAQVVMPENVPTGFTWQQEAAGSLHSLGIGSDGKLYSWGNNLYGFLGDGTTNDRHTPTPVVTPLNAPSGFTWKQASCWGWHSLALGSDNQLYSWGWNNRGELGIGAITGYKPTPVRVNTPQGAPSGFAWKQSKMGDWSSLAIGSDGNIYGWGTGDNGILGNGLVKDSYSPTVANKPNGAFPGFFWKQVSLVGSTALAIGSDNNLYSWGSNGQGQVGDNTTTQRNTPVRVATPPNTPSGLIWLQVSAGWDNTSFGLASDGNLYSWGNNSNGQLGDGTTNERHTPGRVSLSDVVTTTSVHFGRRLGTGLSRNNDGTWQVITPQHKAGWVNVTVSWMMNGQQPDVYLSYTYIGAKLTVAFTSADSSCPTASGMPQSQTVTEGRQAKRPSPDPKANGCLFDGWFIKDAGNDSWIAYDFSQQVTGNITLAAHWTRMDTHWSLNPDKGNVLGGQQVTITPPTINRGIRFNQASAGGSFSIGVASDGNAYAWGNNKYGQLGNGDTAQRTKPTRVPLPEGVDSGFTYTQIAAGGAHVLAIGSNGVVYSWGHNDHGQLGNGSQDANPHTKPEPVKDPVNRDSLFKAVQVSAGAYDSAAIDDKGHIYTWGAESNDQNAYSPAKLVPTQAASINGSEQTLIATQVSVRWAFVMALDNDGTIYTWGYDSFSRSGNSADYAPNPTPLPNQSFEATQISAGGWHALAVDTDSNTWAWGYNQYGQLGNGTTSGTSPQATPARVQNPAGGDQGFKAKRISAGVFHAIVIDNDGRTWAWGRNGYGQLGINSTSNASVPTPVRNPSKPGDASQQFPASIIGAGDSHSLAVGSDGNLWAWGDDQYGQLGIENTTNSLVAAQTIFDPTPLVLTGVKFGGIAGTSLYRNTDGTWSITNPPHDAGPVDVAVDWTIDNAAQTTAHLGYTYEGILPRAGSAGLLVLLAAGLLAAAGAMAAASHQRETSRRRH